MMKWRYQKSAIPAFFPTLGIGIFYLSFIVVLPLSALVAQASVGGWSSFVESAFSQRAIASYILSFKTAFIASIVNAIFGFMLAWILARYEFWGKGIFDALVDMPFALPTAVAGIALTALYSSQGLIGSYCEMWGIQIAFSELGIIVALIFVGVPFCVRTLLPALKDIPIESEEAAMTLGAKGGDIFLRIILPSVGIAWVSGFMLSFARAIGEYGSVVFISGNIPYETEIAPLIIVTKLEQFNVPESASIACVMLVISLIFFTLTEWLSRKVNLGGLR